MRATHATLMALAVVVACSDDPGKVEADAAPTNRLFTFLSVERWSRGASETYTMVGTMTLNTDGTPPSMTRIDERCRVHEGAWPGTAPSHGTWTFTGGNVGSVSFSDGFETEPPMTPGWKAGDMLTMSAAGASLPAVTLAAAVPEPVMLTSIDMPTVPLFSVTLSRTRPFELTWAPASGEAFALVLQFNVLSPGVLEIVRGIHCGFPAADGHGAIPAAALARLAPMSGLGTNLYFGGVVRKTAVLPGVDVEMINWNGWNTRVVVE